MEDLYCPNPDCHCNEVTLQFMGSSQDSGGRVDIKTLFTGKVSFKAKIGSIKCREATEEQAQALMRLWYDQYGIDLAALKVRYEKIKELGRRSLEETDPHAPARTRREPVRRGTKIGRNAPCPCGSGKKYKKCCGR